MNDTSKFTHLDPSGHAHMVDVGNKKTNRRSARAEARVDLGATIAGLLRETGAVAKGNVLETARIAGIQAAKKTPDLIPMCHPLLLDSVEVDCTLEGDHLIIRTEVRCAGRTGVEMEALTAASTAALTVYDMCKSADKGIVITSIRLLEKTGGKSGAWCAGSEEGEPHE